MLPLVASDWITDHCSIREHHIILYCTFVLSKNRASVVLSILRALMLFSSELDCRGEGGGAALAF